MWVLEKNPFFPKRRDVIEYVTREDNLAFRALPEARKIIRMALPGEKVWTDSRWDTAVFISE